MAKAATYKVYTGSAWEELTFTPSSHTHGDYIKGLTVSGQTITYTKGDGSTGTITTQDTNSDTNVTQTNTTTDSDYRVLFSGNANDTTQTTTARKSANFKVNPSTGRFTAKSFSDNKYAYNVINNVTSSTPVETIIYTKIKYVSSAYMPVVRIYGYAYGLQSPIELKLGFYIYSGALGYCGVVSMGAWRPDVYLFKYVEDSVEYVAIGLAGSCYYLGFQVDLQIPALGSLTSTNISLNNWSITFSKDAGVIPAVGTDNCIKVPYKSTLNSLTINGTTYDGTTARSFSLATADHNHDSAYSTLANTIKSLSINGKTITYTKGDNTTGTLTTQDTTYSVVTAASGGTNSGLVLASEKYIWNNKQDSLTAGTNITISGNTISATDTTYSVATASKPGLVKPVSVITKPTLNSVTTTSGKYYQVQMSSDGNMFVNVPWTDENTTYSAATSSDLGLVKIGSNITNSSGTISLTKANVTSALGYTPPTTDTTYSNATTTDAGLMSADDKKNLTYYVKGTQTASTNAWTGNLTQISALYEGLTIRYKLPYAGTSSGATLNLTLSGGATGAKKVYRYGTSTQITTHFSANSVITMTYDGTNWIVDAFYDSNSYAYVRQYVTSTNADYPVLFAYETTMPSSYDTKYTSKNSNLTFNPSTGTLSATSFVENGTALGSKYASLSYVDANFPKVAASTALNSGGIVTASGNMLSTSGKTFETTLTDSSSKVPVSSAVKSYVDTALSDIGGGSPIIDLGTTTEPVTDEPHSIIDTLKEPGIYKIRVIADDADNLYEYTDEVLIYVSKTTLHSNGSMMYGQTIYTNAEASIRTRMFTEGTSSSWLTLSSGKILTPGVLATHTSAGAVKLYSSTYLNSTPNDVTNTSGRTYAIQRNTAGQLVVNVPWVEGSSSGTSTDTKSSTYHTTTNANYPLTFEYASGITSTSTLTNYKRRSNKLYFNPSTGILTVPKISDGTTTRTITDLATISDVNTAIEMYMSANYENVDSGSY